MHAAQPQRMLSRLESLPGELRNRIYRCAVVEDKGVIAATITDWQARSWRSTQPALAATCKQFRIEILPIFYAENTFLLAPTQGEDISLIAIRGWVGSISRHYRPMIESVGASFYIMKTFEDGRKESVEAQITADVSLVTSMIFHVSDELADKCDCILRHMHDTKTKMLRRSRVPKVANHIEVLLTSCCSELFEHYMKTRRGTHCKECLRSMGTP